VRQITFGILNCLFSLLNRLGWVVSDVCCVKMHGVYLHYRIRHSDN
jgi:hypothetical protein